MPPSAVSYRRHKYKWCPRRIFHDMSCPTHCFTKATAWFLVPWSLWTLVLYTIWMDVTPVCMDDRIGFGRGWLLISLWIPVVLEMVTLENSDEHFWHLVPEPQFACDADKYACWTVCKTILTHYNNHCLTCISKLLQFSSSSSSSFKFGCPLM
jgi:hypothetical protein